MPTPLPVRIFDATHIKPPRDFVRPILDPAKPLDLEIGCGVGLHPIRYAKANPGRQLIAIEHTREKFDKFAGRVAHHPQLTNLTAVHADAIPWITHALANDTIDRLFLLYPNPEPQSPNQRWLRMPFFSRLKDVLKTGGTLTLATNIESYFREACDYGQGIWKLEIFHAGPVAKDSKPRTHFEKKYLERGEICFDVTFRKP